MLDVVEASPPARLQDGGEWIGRTEMDNQEQDTKA
jgi:hypothetical protein